MKKVDRTVFKKCPECDKQCPVALRSCNCGYAFTRTRPSRQTTKQKASTSAQSASSSRSSSSSKGEPTPPPDPDSNLDKVGRRFRTKRMRPDYFNSMELEYASRTFRTRKPKPDDKDLKGKKKRGRPKGSSSVARKPKEFKRKEEEEAKAALPELEDLYANFSPQKMQQFSFILDELNLKMSSQIFKPL